jgi:hypothetical protein
MSRLRAIALPILALAMYSCSDPLTPSEETRKVSFTTLINSTRYFELASEPAYVVLRGRSDEEQFLTSYPRDTSYSSSGEPSVESFPVVDYDRQLVIGI